MIGTGLAGRVTRLERSAGRDRCPAHDPAIGVRRVEDGVMTVTRVPARHPCRRCGRPASEFWLEVMIIPSRRREDLAR